MQYILQLQGLDIMNNFNNQNNNNQNNWGNNNSYNNQNNSYTNQQGTYNTNYNSYTPNEFYNNNTTNNINNQRGFNSHINNPDENSNVFRKLKKILEENRKPYNRYGEIPPGVEIISAKEPFDVKVGVIIAFIAFLALTLVNSYEAFESGIEQDKISAMIVGIALHSILLGVCIGITLFPIVNGILKLLRCTKKVTATIIDVKVEDHIDGYGDQVRVTRSYTPIYKYSYLDKIYIIEAAINRHLGNPRLGKKFKIRINENNPQDYYMRSVFRDVLIVLLGAIMVYFLSQVNIFTKYI